MSLSRNGALLVVMIALLYAAVALSVVSTPSLSTFTTAIRLAALPGLLSLSIATIMTPFLPEIYRLFAGRSLRYTIFLRPPDCSLPPSTRYC